MNATLRLFLALLLLLPWLGRPPAFAEDPSREAIDGLARPLIESRYTMGVVVLVIRPDREEIFAYGTVAAGGSTAPDRNTVFPLASITKTFTAQALASLAAHGRVRLGQPVQDLLPPGTRVPGFGARVITLEDLATHTSGLPRVPTPWTPFNPCNPYADYTPSRLYDFLAGYELPREPGSRYEYSNLGAGLLGYALALRERKTVEALLLDEVCRPLGMCSTAIHLSPDLIARAAQGHDLMGTAVPRWDFQDALAGCGALNSTADDLIRYVRAQMAESTPTVRQVHTARHPLPGDKWSIGLGWHVSRDGNIAWHDGGTYGSYSFVGFNKRTGVGLVWLSNSSLWQFSPLLERLQAFLEGAPVPRLRPQRLVSVDVPVLATYVGEYEMAPGKVLAVTLADDALMLTYKGDPVGVPLWPVSKTDFVLMSLEDRRLSFVVNPNGTVTGVMLHRGGEKRLATKVR